MESEELLTLEDDISSKLMALQVGKQFGQLLEEPNAAESKPVTPKPGFCIKTKDIIGEKVFLNLCCSEELPVPADVTDEKLLEILESDDPTEFRIPLSLGEPHMEKDKSGKACTVYDVMVNPSLFAKVEKSELYRTFLVTVMMEGLEDKYSIGLNKQEWIVLKNKKYLGTLKETNIRVPQKPLITELEKGDAPIDVQTKRQEDFLTARTTTRITSPAWILPEFSITYRGGNRGELLANVHLPTAQNCSSIKVDVGEDRLLVECGNTRLDTYLPVLVSPDACTARYSNKVLTVVMPIIHQK